MVFRKGFDEITYIFKDADTSGTCISCCAMLTEGMGGVCVIVDDCGKVKGRGVGCEFTFSGVAAVGGKIPAALSDASKELPSLVDVGAGVTDGADDVNCVGCRGT